MQADFVICFFPHHHLHCILSSFFLRGKEPLTESFKKSHTDWILVQTTVEVCVCQIKIKSHWIRWINLRSRQSAMSNHCLFQGFWWRLNPPPKKNNPKNQKRQQPVFLRTFFFYFMEVKKGKNTMGSSFTTLSAPQHNPSNPNVQNQALNSFNSKPTEFIKKATFCKI